MQNMKKAVLLLILLTSLAACSEEAPPLPQNEPRPVKVYTVPKAEQWENRRLPGKVLASQKVDLAFRVAGELQQLPVNAGDKVTQGQVVAQLDTRDFQVALKEAQSRLAGAKASLHEAQLNLQRNKDLLEKDVISKSAYDNALSTYENAKAQTLSLEEQVHQATLQLDYTTLAAPFDGLVATKYVKNFQTVQAQEPIIRLEDISEIDIEVDIPEFIWARASRNKRSGAPKATVSFSALPEYKFPVTLKEYETRANPQTQTYSVTLTMPQPEDFDIFPGMTAEVEGFLPKEDGNGGLYIPVQAVFGGVGDKQYAWIVQQPELKVTKAEVTSGSLTDTSIEVLTGVEPGQMVVIAGIQELQEGQQVRIFNPDTAPVQGETP